jgi:hypothetical protein
MTLSLSLLRAAQHCTIGSNNAKSAIHCKYNVRIFKLRSIAEQMPALVKSMSDWKLLFLVFGMAKMPGVDVMITIFCEFRQFSAKKWRFSQKPML